MEYPTLLDVLGRQATAMAEVGAHAGRSASGMRKMFPSATFYLIDPWAHCVIPRSKPLADDSPEMWARVEARCRERFANDTRVVFMKTTSDKAARQIADASLDIVRIDAGREYHWMWHLIDTWLPKLAGGGVFTGTGLVGRCRGDVRQVLRERWPNRWVRVGHTNWAVKQP